MITNSSISIFIWALVGLGLGLMNLYLQKLSINYFQDLTDKKSVAGISFMSFLRILSASLILFFAFQSGFAAGLYSLFLFIAMRWIGLVFLVKFAKERK